MNLDGMAGQPADRVFLSMVEYVCPPGGTMDEGIARQAMLDAIADMADSGAPAFDGMTTDQRCDFFVEFVIHSIEGQVMAELFQRGIALPESADGVQYVQDQLQDFVAGCIRGQFGGNLTGVGQMSNQQIDGAVRAVYESAFGLIEALATSEAEA